MHIRLITEADAEALWLLRLKALSSEPRAFSESADEHRKSTVDSFGPRLRSNDGDNFILGAFDGTCLVGMAGFYRVERLKESHKGRIWGVYVAPEGRRRGAGRQLITGILERLRRLPGLTCVVLTVATTQQAARGLYLSLGFRSYGIEPRALRVGEEYVDEELMILDLEPGNIE